MTSPLLGVEVYSTTAGLGYFGSKCELSMQISPWIIWKCPDWHNSTVDFNPLTQSRQYKQALSLFQEYNPQANIM
jgi:hypothetical protein